MYVDKSKLKIHKVVKNEINTMVQHRINYLIELQGPRDEKYKNQLKKELTSFFSKSIAEGSFIAMVAKIENRIIGYGGMIIKQMEILRHYSIRFFIHIDIRIFVNRACNDDPLDEQIRQFFSGYRVQIIRPDGHIRKFPFFDGSLFVFFEGGIRRTHGVETQRFLNGDSLCRCDHPSGQRSPDDG